MRPFRHSVTIFATAAKMRSASISQVPNSDQQDFAVLLSGTSGYLAVANGGKGENASGFDIVFAGGVRGGGESERDHHHGEGGGGSKSGTAQVLQGGVWSNAVSFGLNTSTLTEVSPLPPEAGCRLRAR